MLIVDWQPATAAALSTVSVGELHAGVALAPNAPEKRRRRQRLDEILRVYPVVVVDLPARSATWSRSPAGPTVHATARTC